MSVVRYDTINNTTGAALTSALSTAGTDMAVKVIRRTLGAADVGANAGQTQEANGCLVAQVKGTLIKEVLDLQIYRPLGGMWMKIANNYGIANAATVFSVTYGISADGSTLYIRDGGGANCQLVANDFIVVTLLLGAQ